MDNSSKLSLFSGDKAAVLLIDHQIGLLTGVRDMDVGKLKHNVVALAKVARVLDVPIIMSATAPDGMWGPTMPELTEALPDVEVINRTMVNAWDEPRFVAAVEATGRRQLIIAGLSLGVCATFPALSATAAGYDVRVVPDASGSFDKEGRAIELQRLQHAGIAVADYGTIVVELLRNNADPKAANVYAAMDIPFAVQVGQLYSLFAKTS